MKITARRHDCQILIKYFSNLLEHQRYSTEEQLAEGQAWTSSSQKCLGIDLHCCSLPRVNTALTAKSPRNSLQRS